QALVRSETTQQTEGAWPRAPDPARLLASLPGAGVPAVPARAAGPRGAGVALGLAMKFAVACCSCSCWTASLRERQPRPLLCRVPRVPSGGVCEGDYGRPRG